MGMTVMELMRSDKGQVAIAELLHAKFGCPGKNYPCMKSYASGVKVCVGCWINFFSTQVPEVKGEVNEAT